MENNPTIFMGGCTSYTGPHNGNQWAVAFG